jgi:hypothetical protein
MKNTCLILLALLPVAGIAQNPLMEVASFGQNMMIGCKVSMTGRLFASFPKREPFLYALAEQNSQRQVIRIINIGIYH